MATAPRLRKRVCAIRRAPDGSAFQKCGACGVSVAVALADMHHCEAKMEVKRFKGISGMRSLPQNNQQFKNQPISPYRLFIAVAIEAAFDHDSLQYQGLRRDCDGYCDCDLKESFMKGYEMENYIEIDRIGFEKWKNMSEEEKQPFVSHARGLDYKHQEVLKQEAGEIIKVNDGADSAMVGKVDQSHWIYIDSSEDSEE